MTEDDQVRACEKCYQDLVTKHRAETELEKQKKQSQQAALKAKKEGTEPQRSAAQTVDQDFAAQVQQKMRLQAAVQKQPPAEEKPSDLVLEPLPMDWFEQQYGIQVISEQHWQKDETVTKCTTCAAEFTNANRRHHCRACGKIYCTKCAPFVGVSIEAVKQGTEEALRTCEKCVQRAIATHKRTAQARADRVARVLAEKRATPQSPSQPS